MGRQQKEEKQVVMRIVLNIELHKPYAKSIDLLLEFCNLWSCHLIKITPYLPLQTIGIDFKQYKKIWNRNPVKKQQLEVPEGMEHFVKDISIENIDLN